MLFVGIFVIKNKEYGFLGLSQAISGYLRVSQSIHGYLGLSRAISDYLRLSWTISGYFGLVEAGESKLLLFETFWFFFLTGSIEELALLKTSVLILNPTF